LECGSIIAVIDARLCPDLMTRFREEVYAARWYKAAKREKAKSTELLSWAKSEGPSQVRLEYVAIARKGYRKKPPRKDQAASVRMF